ncbi:hypothetical protein [Nocardioides bizhenqiangii]|uniref:Lipoprotein n=1 Tax=Nocardioides bizhenqiangii TaxID=3095076 RepID=A0ABZ0ZX22_9ACTN|nr:MULTISPECIES: hypothetical protein [unclassified Nocardioides]MDZ5623313.1 hypothetical protein [Nocardioides sp. HM23]WQQ28296.1 hypothetical protein SHK19_08690 [Nocardioides sp. HM61]
MNLGAAGLAAVILSAVLGGCGTDDDGAKDPAARKSDRPLKLPQADEPFKLDPAGLRPEVTNPWFPLVPGTRWTYREVDEDGEVLEVVVTATSQTRTIANGAEARVVRDTVTLDGEIIEDTLDWYAQDGLGTVWYLGEDTAEFEDGYLVNHEGSFEAGVDDALAGVIMPATPTVGQSYRQEYYAGVAEDNGEVLALDGTATVPAGSYEDLVKTADTNALEPDVLEHKFYARDVGVVLTIDVGSKAREELVSVTTVSDAEARRAGTAPLGSPY